MFDGKAFGEQMVEVVRSYVDEATAPLKREIEELKARQIEAGPAGADGADGKDGVDGKVDMDAVMARVDEVLKAIPTPQNGKDGRDGIDGKDGAPGERGEVGERGLDGADGVGVAGALIDRDGILNLTLTNGEVKSLGRVEGRDGKDGERGLSGFGLDDFDTDWRPDEKVLVLSWQAGETKTSHELFVPYLRDAGVWKEGAAYLQGDCVSWAGSMWTAQEDTSEKPETGKAWRLSVKRGRDGKDFAGPQSKPGAKVSI